MALYRSGQAVLVRHPVVSRPYVGWRAVLPMKAVQDMLRASYARTQRLNTPPAGQAFIVDGVPYATPPEFVDDLVDELRAQLLRYLATGKEGSQQQ